MPVGAGDVIAGKYRVERLLGRGGMGYVVAARHQELGQIVAIKFLRQAVVKDENALARFRREAQACVRLRNEHVACVIDVGLHEDEPYIVMEYLDGAELGMRSDAEGALPIPEACDYIIQACEGLAEAHALGIIHRDIKLPNLFVTKTAAGEPLLKVLDFGVSKTLAADAREFTLSATCLGSPKYMSPEQMNDARDVDARTDIWSLGVCLYRLITGRAPFDGDTIGRVCTMVLHESAPSIAALHPEVPPLLEAIIGCCLMKERDHRFANVAELAAALAPFASDPARAANVTEHIASILGVIPCVPGYLPPPPMGPGAGFDGPGAWAHTTRRAAFTNYGRGGGTRILYGTGIAFLALTVAAKALLPMPGSARTTAAAGGGGSTRATPVVVQAPPIATVAFPSTINAAPATVAAAPSDSTTTTSGGQTTTTSAQTTTTTHKKARARPANKPPRVRDDDGLTGSESAAIPSDRK